MFRFFDFTFALLGLIFAFPVLLVIYVLGLFDTGSPLFRQERVGRHQKPFVLVKFRTMKIDTTSVASHLASSASITRMGAFLRKTKLDELPQLWNVLKGEMSLVGPRPLLPEYLSLYNEEQRKRHYVKPGITGWAQVNGRNALSWEEKFKYDVEYVEKISPSLDAKIVLVTMEKVVKRHGVNANNYMTMEAFKGNVA